MAAARCRSRDLRARRRSKAVAARRQTAAAVHVHVAWELFAIGPEVLVEVLVATGVV